MEQDLHGNSDNLLRHVFAAGFYAAVSISTTFFNKAVLSVFNFKHANFLLLTQHIFTLLILEIMKALRMMNYPAPEISKCKKLLPVALLYSLNVGVALGALELLNIPMYGVLKRLTVLFVLIGESAMGKHSSMKLKQSVCMIVGGAIIAGLGDLTFDMLGYLLACFSCLAQASYLVYVAKTGAESGINTFGLLFYNSLLAIPFVFVIVLVLGEFQAVSEYPNLWALDFQICFLCNMIMGAMLNYSMFLCTTVNSALTTTIMGQLKNVISIFLGLFVFGGVETTFVNIFGLGINCLGGIWYAEIKYEENISSKKNKIIPKKDEES